MSFVTINKSTPVDLSNDSLMRSMGDRVVVIVDWWGLRLNDAQYMCLDKKHHHGMEWTR